VIALYEAIPSSCKARNKTIVDRHGNAAVVEVSTTSVAVRRAVNSLLVYSSNSYVADGQKPLTEQVRHSAYVQNTKAREVRLAELCSGKRHLETSDAMTIVQDTNDGKTGQVCLDNRVMYTRYGSLWNCRDVSLTFFPGHPATTAP